MLLSDIAAECFLKKISFQLFLDDSQDFWRVHNSCSKFL